MEKTQKRPLEDKVAIITGGGTGIGEAICHKFARQGAKVVVNGLPGDPIDDVVSAILDEGGEAIAFPGDISNDKTALACVNEAMQHYGKLDILVNNAGILLVDTKTDDAPVGQFDEHIRCARASAAPATVTCAAPTSPERKNCLTGKRESF